MNICPPDYHGRNAVATVDRRAFLKLATGTLATGLLASSPLALAIAKPKIGVIAFDAFAIFDPGSVFALARKLVPGKGAELSDAWRARQFEYTWLRTISRSYTDFWKVTEDALVFAAKLLKIDLSLENRQQLMNAYLELKPYPDAVAALKSLKDADFRMALLSDMTPLMLEASIKSSGLEEVFEHILSTDAVRTYKPDPLAYQMAFGLKREGIAFVAFGGWDAAGAKLFGYPTFWVNRLGLPTEELGIAPDGIGTNLTDLADFVRAQG